MPRRTLTVMPPRYAPALTARPNMQTWLLAFRPPEGRCRRWAPARPDRAASPRASLGQSIAHRFFPGQAKGAGRAALASLKARYADLYARNEPRSSMKGLRPHDRARYHKRVWATRKAPWVDRLASAWLIKRFIDRDAKFVWIARPSECPKKAVGFDYDGAEFTHVKNRVTFEVLAAAFGLDQDPALAKIGAAVHFLDVGGIPVPDATGLETMLKGAKEKARGDDALLAEAMRTFDLLHSAYRAHAGRAGKKLANAPRGHRLRARLGSACSAPARRSPSCWSARSRRSRSPGCSISAAASACWPGSSCAGAERPRRACRAPICRGSRARLPPAESPVPRS
jgi:hypothetical protein